MKTQPTSALVIIDMQKGMALESLPPRNNADAESHMLALLAHWRAQHWPVVHVRHMSRSPASVFWPGQVGAEFQERFMPLPHEHVVEKNITCAFTASGLERWLHQRGLSAVVVVGVSTNFSVEASARTAAQLGFATTVASDATFTFDLQAINGRTLAADELHLLSLSNLQAEYAKVLATADILRANMLGPHTAHA